LAYSYVAYQTAWLKANYPGEFLAANMTAEMNSLDKIVQLVDEAGKYNIKVLPPDINRSIDKFTVVNGMIYFGMAAIKNVGTGAVESIVEARKEKPFTSFFDFAARCDSKQVNKRVLEALICSGAFDSIDKRRASLFESIESAISYSKLIQSKGDTSMDSLFGGANAIALSEPPIHSAAEWSDKVRLEKEKEYLNFYISGNPMDQYKAYINSLSTMKFGQIEPSLINQKVRVTGIVNSIRNRMDKRNNSIAFVELEDYTGKAEIIFWSDAYSKFQKFLKENVVLMIMGKAEADGDNLKIVAENVMEIEEAAKTYAKGYIINIDYPSFDQSIIDSLSGICLDTAANSSIIFNIYNLPHTAKRSYLAKNMRIGISPDCLKKMSELFGRDMVKLYC